MAGSIKWFEYEADGGETFGVRMDESNGEAVSNPDFTASSTAVYAIPRNLKPRRARYVSADGLRVRSIVVCTAGTTTGDLPATIAALIEGSATPVTLQLATFEGEKFRAIPKAEDTGLTDGDAT